MMVEQNRPTAEKLLNHAFFRQAKKKSYLVSGMLHNLPPIENRPSKRATQKPVVIEKGISWDFDGDDAADSGEVRRPRTVTFERYDHPVSTATTESAQSSGTAMTPTAETARTIDTLHDEPPSSQSSTPLSSHAGDKPARKSRFVVEDGSTAGSSPALHSTPEVHPSPQTGLSHNMSSLSLQSGQNLQGLGVTPHVAELPEVKKGRFSVKDTSGTSSPAITIIKTMPSDIMHSPSRSLTSSPIEAHPDGVRIAGGAEPSPVPEVLCSVHSTPTTSPTGSILRGQPGLQEALGVQSIQVHLDALYRQNEQQRNVLNELSAGLGIKPVSRVGTPEGGPGFAINNGSFHRQESNPMGLKFIAKDRQDRLTAIGRYLADPARGYDIVGLQEVWVRDDYLRIKELVKDTLPYTKTWHSGALGSSGLVILSKFPIVATSMRRFALNGDPFKFYHGDWYVGKCVVSATIVHPTCGEIEVFNTHLHAGYDPVGTPDSYLGCRVGEAWEMASLVKAATTQGRHVISVGDYNSAPDSYVIQLLRKQGGLTDSWDKMHPEPRNPIPSGLTPEEGVTIMGVTCDTPLNSWAGHHWLNYLTKDPIGERLDYVFYKETPEMTCTHVEVALKDQIAGIGKPNSGLKNYSDHFGVNARFLIHPAVYHFQNRSIGDSALSNNSPSFDSLTTLSKEQELTVDFLEEILLVLKQHLANAQARSRLELLTVTPLTLLGVIGLNIAYFWIQPRWAAFIVAWIVSILAAATIVHFLYGLLFGGEISSAFNNTIQEVQTVLDYKLAVSKHQKALSIGEVSRNNSSSSGRGRQGLLQN
ncbi:phospholipase C type enzyme [Linnemannia zychae]|nr:phospholipase C type enzyme [Linnemannia zychae]